MDNPFNTKYSIQAMIGAGVTIIALALMQYFFSQSPSVDEMMAKTASEFNKTCPMMVDQITRMDNALALPGRIFQYNFTMINMDVASIEIEELKKNLEPVIVNTVKTSPELKLFRDKEITMVYYYRDINGNYMFKISVGPNQYNN